MKEILDYFGWHDLHNRTAWGIIFVSPMGLVVYYEGYKGFDNKLFPTWEESVYASIGRGIKNLLNKKPQEKSHTVEFENPLEMSVEEVMKVGESTFSYRKMIL